MNAWIPDLATQLSALPDTIVTISAQPPGGLFERIAGIASGLSSIALLILAVFLVPAAWNFRKSYKRVNLLLDRIYADINPIVKHASTISDNIDYITTSVRVDVQQINRTVAEANRALLQVIELSEKRIHDFNALLEVMQREAEGVFVATASTLRGVREGASEFQRDQLDPEPPDDILDAYEEYDAEEEDHGDDERGPAAAREPSPRIKRH